jgi:hypothetical protein
MARSRLKVRKKGWVILGGPARSESEARRRLEERLYEHLSECFYLDDSGRAAHYAQEIASEVPYQVKGTRIVVDIHLDVLYRNPPGGWKWWVSIRTDEGGQTVNNVEPGDPA